MSTEPTPVTAEQLVAGALERVESELSARSDELDGVAVSSAYREAAAIVAAKRGSAIDQLVAELEPFRAQASAIVDAFERRERGALEAAEDLRGLVQRRYVEPLVATLDAVEDELDRFGRSDVFDSVWPLIYGLAGMHSVSHLLLLADDAPDIGFGPAATPAMIDLASSTWWAW